MKPLPGNHGYRLAVLIVALLVMGWPDLFSRAGSEKGQYLSVLNFNPRQYRGRPQNTDITEDYRGILYFANRGILAYDGIFWDHISVNDKLVYSLEADRNGIVYVGSENEIGYLRTDQVGRQEYVSLVSSLEEGARDFGSVWEVHATGEGVYFKADQYLFRWNGDTVVTWHTENLFDNSFHVNRELYTREEGRGLLVMKGDSLVTVEGGERFSQTAIRGMIPFRETGILIFTERDGIYHMIPRGEGGGINMIRHFNELDNFLQENLVSCALRISFNQFAIGSQGKGAVVYDQSNDQFDFLNFSSGLQDEVIYNMHLDRRGNLWMALSNGISMSPVGTPVTRFGYSAGIKESVEGICRFRNNLVISTILGTLILEGPRGAAIPSGFAESPPGGGPGFGRVNGLGDEGFACTSFRYGGEELLLVATYYGVSQCDSRFRTEQVLECYPWYIYQSRIYPERVIIANEDGIISMFRQGGEWIRESYGEGIGENCRIVAEDHRGNVWVGTQGSGKAIMIESAPPGSEESAGFTVYDSAHHLPLGDIYLQMYGDEMVFGTSRGLYRYDEGENEFYPDTSFGLPFGDGSRGIHRISVDHEGYLWLVTYDNATGDYETGYFVPGYDGNYSWVNEPFLSFSQGVIHGIHHDPDGVTWLGGPDGLFRYDRNIEKDYRLGYQTVIRKVFLRGDSLLFGGTFTGPDGLPALTQNPEEIRVIRYKHNSVALEYAAPPNEDGSPVLFSHCLEGFDEEWSDWSPEYRREYTNLREKRYTFRVKARNLYNHESEETSYTFIIRPPWFRTIPVILLFVLTGASILWLAVVLYTRGLRTIIRERTAEIREQKELIEEKNVDIMDSITYAQRIQSALLPPGDYLDGLFPERFILYLPRDIVSGDFYWMTERNRRIIVVTADCTGHGVPGAMMSMMGMSYLNEITSANLEITPDGILNQLRAKIVASLRQKGVEGESRDGMDMALYIMDPGKMELEFSGANLPLYLFRNKELQMFRPDKMPIGISDHLDTPFTRHRVKLEKGDILYTFSDGFPDQFGGPKNKKFMIKRFRELLEEIHTRPLRQQKNLLLTRLEQWKMESNCEQVDDITVLGVKVS